MKSVYRGKRGNGGDLNGPRNKRHAPDILSNGIDEREEERIVAEASRGNPGRDERAAGVFDKDKDFLDGLKHGRKGARVKGAERILPAFPEGLVTTIVKQGVDVHSERDENVPLSMRAVPLGSPECQDAVPGEWACTRIMPRSFRPKTILGDAQIDVTSTPNGLPADTAFQVVGIVRKTVAGAGDGGDRGTVQIAGKISTTNTGWNTIPPFTPCVLSTTPYSIIDETTGQMVPGIIHAGEPSDKFLFGVHPLDERTVLEATEKIRAEVQGWFEAKKADIQSQVPGTAKAAAEAIAKLADTRIAELIGQFNASERPAARYLFWHVIDRLTEVSETWTANDDLAVLYKKYKGSFIDSSDDKEFMLANGLTSTTSRASEAAVIKLLTDGANMSENVFTVRPYLASNKEKAIVFWMHRRRQMSCGKSLNFANVGGELDLLA